ncbi:MAG TPA: multicopper oxidase domain-containing protein, partial [Terriglobales bacterium]|nr:multicopper oxidase domain-containing protein [Terriglobales bacterium]
MKRSCISKRKRAWNFIVLAMVACLVGIATVSAEALPNITVNDNRARAGKLESGVLTLHLELGKGVWHPGAEDGTAAQPLSAIETYAFAEAGHELQTPGPLIRVLQGTELRVTVHNALPVETFIHGIEQHPGDSKKAVELKPGETKELSFTAGEPGSYLYWATTGADERDDSDGAMSGAFIVDAPDTRTDDRIFVIQLWNRDILTPNFQAILTINGKSWPYTERLQARIGHSEHWRIINASEATHPMHLHGFYFTVDGVGDGLIAHHLSEGERRLAVTEVVEPHHTFDMTWMPQRTGNWLFHCHILDHMSSYFSPFFYGPGSPATPAHAHHADNH